MKITEILSRAQRYTVSRVSMTFITAYVIGFFYYMSDYSNTIPPGAKLNLIIAELTVVFVLCLAMNTDHTDSSARVLVTITICFLTIWLVHHDHPGDILMLGKSASELIIAQLISYLNAFIFNLMWEDVKSTGIYNQDPKESEYAYEK